MAKLILKVSFINNKIHKSNLIGYIATRDGVELNKKNNKEVTDSQLNLINDLIDEFPKLKETEEYKIFKEENNRILASNFISNSIENLDSNNISKNIYMKYIAERPRVEKFETHGLFNKYGVADLDKEIKNIKNHNGVVWNFIISQVRNDSEKNGFNNAKSYQELIKRRELDLANALEIEPKNLIWNGAFHNEGNHPHIHLMVYSKDENEGFLNKKNIEKFKSILMRDIFKDEFLEIEKEKSEIRNKIRNDFRTLVVEKFKNPLDEEEKEIIKNINIKGNPYYKYQSEKTKENIDKLVEKIFNTNDLNLVDNYKVFLSKENEIKNFYKETKLNLDDINILEDNEFNQVLRNAILKNLNKENLDFEYKNLEVEEELKFNFEEYSNDKLQEIAFNLKNIKNNFYKYQEKEVKENIDSFIKEYANKYSIDITKKNNLNLLRNELLNEVSEIKNKKLEEINNKLKNSIKDRFNDLSENKENEFKILIDSYKDLDYLKKELIKDKKYLSYLKRVDDKQKIIEEKEIIIKKEDVIRNLEIEIKKYEDEKISSFRNILTDENLILNLIDDDFNKAYEDYKKLTRKNVDIISNKYLINSLNYSIKNEIFKFKNLDEKIYIEKIFSNSLNKIDGISKQIKYKNFEDNNLNVRKNIEKIIDELNVENRELNLFNKEILEKKIFNSALFNKRKKINELEKEIERNINEVLESEIFSEKYDKLNYLNISIKEIKFLKNEKRKDEKRKAFLLENEEKNKEKINELNEILDKRNLVINEIESEINKYIEENKINDLDLKINKNENDNIRYLLNTNKKINEMYKEYIEFKGESSSSILNNELFKSKLENKIDKFNSNIFLQNNKRHIDREIEKVFEDINRSGKNLKSKYDIELNNLADKLSKDSNYRNIDDDIKLNIEKLYYEFLDDKIISKDYIKDESKNYIKNDILLNAKKLKFEKLYNAKREINDTFKNELYSELNEYRGNEKEKKELEKNIQYIEKRIKKIIDFLEKEEIRNNNSEKMINKKNEMIGLVKSLVNEKNEMKNKFNEINNNEKLESLSKLIKTNDGEILNEKLYKYLLEKEEVRNKIEENYKIISKGNEKFDNFYEDKEFQNDIKNGIKKIVKNLKDFNTKIEIKNLVSDFESFLDKNFDNENNKFYNKNFNLNDIKNNLNNLGYNFYDGQNDICKEKCNEILDNILQDKYDFKIDLENEFKYKLRELDINLDSGLNDNSIRKEFMNVLLKKSTEIKKTEINNQLSEIKEFSDEILNKLISKNFNYDDELTKDLFELSKILNSRTKNPYFIQDEKIKNEVDSILKKILNGEYEGTSSKDLNVLYKKYLNGNELKLDENEEFKNILRDRLLQTSTNIKSEYFTYKDLNVKYEYLNKVNQDNLKYATKNLCLDIGNSLFKMTKEEMEGEQLIKSRNRRLSQKAKLKKKMNMSISY
ncbi:MobP3 family relaxase [Clostridium thermobutyricum]|uniref:MobP3 family relaxase n=1 Tax=Clostridium thermobutyricum TaxID=29372 RepID=UPI0029429F83|nr:MobP3 family relaxase [Clostridium thermobutyricum]